MLAHPALERLHALGLHDLAKGFKEIEHTAEARGLDHAEWLGLLLEYETTLRRQKQFEMRAKAARLLHHASVEDVNYQIPRGLDRRCSSSSRLRLGRRASPSAHHRGVRPGQELATGSIWLAIACARRRAETASDAKGHSVKTIVKPGLSGPRRWRLRA
jgi:hypothetical protein